VALRWASASRSFLLAFELAIATAASFSPLIAVACASATLTRFCWSASALPMSPSRSCSETLILASLMARAAASLPRASM